MEHINNMGYTLQQLQQMGATPGATAGQASATDAYRAMLNNVKTGSVFATSTPEMQNTNSGNIGDLFKDVAQTLLIKPATRIGQAISAPMVQQKMDSTTEIQNEQTDQLQSVLDKLKTETDPIKKQALSKMAHELVNQASSNTAAGQEVTKENNSLAEGTNVNLGGANFDIPAQQTGAAGVKQITGDALKDASYLAAPEAVEGVGESANLGSKIAKGALSGAAIGGTGSAGSELENPNSTTGSVLKATGKGAITGALIGGVAPAAIEGIKELPKVADTIGTKLESMGQKTTSTGDFLSSRIKDATPDYDKNMVGEKIKTADNETIPRVNEGKGITGKRTVNTKASETASGQELANIQNYPDNGTALQKSQAVDKAITDESQNLKSSLIKEDKENPLDVKEAKDTIYKNVFDNMNGDARDAVISKNGINTAEPTKTITGRYGRDVADALSEYDGTRSGILDLRKNLDQAYENARGKSAFGTDHRNALDEMHTAVRDYLNKELKESTSIKDTQASLDKQTRLYRAKDVLDTKAEAEATSKFERFMQIHPLLKKIGTRGLMRIAIEVTGISLAAATINKVIKNATSGK